MITRDGGPAFPTEWPAKTYEDGSESAPAMMERGMSLRDWFAGQAMVGLLATPGDHVGNPPKYPDEPWMLRAAREAWSIADALLAAQEEKPTP